MPSCRTITGLAAAALAAGIGAEAARASDYSNTCRSSDGAYVIEDGALYAARDTAQSRQLAYAILERQVLEEVRGTCLPSNPEARGASFANVFRKSRQVIAVDQPGGGTRITTVVCEFAASGLPAAFNCDRETKTLDRRSPGPLQRFAVGTPGTWTHNGSVMLIEAEGDTRRIVYMNPREGLRRAGVSGDMMLFEGSRQGSRYEGTARWFSRACGPQTFPVSGTVNADESRIELSGEAPRIDAACKVTGTRREQLVFERTR